MEGAKRLRYCMNQWGNPKLETLVKCYEAGAVDSRKSRRLASVASSPDTS